MFFNFITVLFAISVSIYLIMKKLSPIVALFIGATIGSLLSGANLNEVLDVFIVGSINMSGVNARVVAGGIMAGVLIGSGAMEVIARFIIDNLGEKRLIAAITLSAFVATAVGVFITIGVIILAPIGLEVGKRAGLSKTSVILALSGGGKAGNIISPNANTVIAAEMFGLELSTVMLHGLAPAIAGFFISVLLANRIRNSDVPILDTDIDYVTKTYNISFIKAVTAPIVMIILLIGGPIVNTFVDAQWLVIDAMFALPIAAVIGSFAMGQYKDLIKYINIGMAKVMPVMLTLLGGGALGEMISRSDLPAFVEQVIYLIPIPGFLLAPISGLLMSTATGSTTTGVLLAAGAFVPALFAIGISPISAAVMMHAGTIISDVPHSNYVLATCEVFKINMKKRTKVFPYETLVGIVMIAVTVIIYGFLST